VAILLVVSPVWAGQKNKKSGQKTPVQVSVPELLLGGRAQACVREELRLERDVKPKKGFWARVVDVVAGPPEYHSMVRPYSVVTDSRRTDYCDRPGCVRDPHFLILAQQKYKFYCAPR